MSSSAKLIKRVSATSSYALEMGLPWALFRLTYEIRKKFGRFSRANRRILKRVEEWKKYSKTIPDSALAPFAFQKTDWDSEELQKARKVAADALNGHFIYFSHLPVDLSPEGKIEWNLNPLTGGIAPSHLPWNEIPDFGTFGDIKGVWEASRFPHTYDLVSVYLSDPVIHRELAIRWIAQMSDWIDRNPYPYGPHHKCGQEISLRLLNLAIGVATFHELLDEVFLRKFTDFGFTCGQRILANLDYATHSVKNNHSISESMGLIVCGLLLRGSDFEWSSLYLEKGLKTLNHELSYQVFPDGSYIQHSHNYARIALDVVSATLQILDRSKIDLKKFAGELEEIRSSHQKLFIFLTSMEVVNGRVPNYGANDGAMLFPLPSSTYSDFRESLEFASRVSNGVSIYPEHGKLADSFGVPTNGHAAPPKKNHFDYGGYYILRSENITVHLRSHTYQTRPSHCDPHHLDVWVGDENIFCDSGTYSYNADPALVSKFIGMMGHNTLVLDEENPMIRVGHFGWRNWIRSHLLSFSSHVIHSRHLGYQKKKGVILEREVKLEGRKFTVTDRGFGVSAETRVAQAWNTERTGSRLSELKMKSDGLRAIHPAEISKMYAQKTPSNRIQFEKTTDRDFILQTEMDL